MLLLFVASVAAVQTYNRGPKFEIKSLCGKEALRISIERLPTNSYIGIVFGQGMTNVDMVSIHAKESGEIIIEDLYSRGFYKPTIDTVNNFRVVDRSIISDSYGYSLEIDRDFDTGDNMDSILSYGGPNEWQWAANSYTSSLSYHDKTGWFDATLDSEDCIMTWEEELRL